MDIHENYVKKLGRHLEYPELRVYDKPKHDGSKSQLDEVPIALGAPIQVPPTQGPLVSPLLALLDTQSVILDELIHLR